MPEPPREFHPSLDNAKSMAVMFAAGAFFAAALDGHVIWAAGVFGVLAVGLLVSNFMYLRAYERFQDSRAKAEHSKGAVDAIRDVRSIYEEYSR